MNRLVLASTLAGASLAAGVANASVIYSNGAYNGTIDAFSYVGFADFAVADSFTAAPGATANSVDFVTWLDPSATVTSVTWSLANGNPLNGGTVFASGTVTPTDTFIATNEYGFDLENSSISIGSVPLTGGNYWLELSGGVASDGGNLFWDDNNGSSQAWQSALGSITDYNGIAGSNSEAFSITGTLVPEPTTWALMLVGFGGLGVALRSRRKFAVA